MPSEASALTLLAIPKRRTKADRVAHRHRVKLHVRRGLLRPLTRPGCDDSPRIRPEMDSLDVEGTLRFSGALHRPLPHARSADPCRGGSEWHLVHLREGRDSV